MYEIELFNNKYKVARLSEIYSEKICLNRFSNHKNKALENFIKNTSEDGALESDKTNTNAVYLVVDKDTNEIAFYYALRAAMFDRKRNKSKKWFFRFIKVINYLINNKLSISEIVPTIDLSMFCKNELYSKSDNVKGLGVKIFWNVIYYQVRQIKSITGIKYISLNAADDGSGELIKYYIRDLHFQKLTKDIIAIQEQFDVGCTPMIHEIVSEDNQPESTIVIVVDE